MTGRVAKALRRLAEGDRRRYKALKYIYTHKFKFDTSSKELPF